MKKFGAILVVLVAFASSAFAEKFLSISDIHFNPYADPALVPQLEAADVSQWATILASSTTQTSLGKYGSDITDGLLRSAVGEMQKQIPSPTFVLISGDFFAHDFDENYQKYATDKSQAAFTAFAKKTNAYIASVLRDAYPNTRIYPTLGNNDSDCGDYAVTPNGAFLKDFRDVWSPAVRSRSFDRRFPTGGYYHADVPTLRNVRIIAVNTNFFSTNYEDPCGGKFDSDAGLRELEWLDAELHLARALGKRVWLLFHIPPGVNVYNTVESADACTEPQMFWTPEYAQRYLRITQRHRNTIAGSFAGHTHQDEFRIATGDFIHITPSITPIFGNNPAFEIVDVKHNGEVVSYTAWHLPNVTLPWVREYAFDEAYDKPRYDTATLTQLSSEISSDTTTREAYFEHSSSGNPKSTAGALAKWQGYWCGLKTMTEGAFTTCYCGTAGR